MKERQHSTERFSTRTKLMAIGALAAVGFGFGAKAVADKFSSENRPAYSPAVEKVIAADSAQAMQAMGAEALKLSREPDSRVKVTHPVPGTTEIAGYTGSGPQGGNAPGFSPSTNYGDAIDVVFAGKPGAGNVIAADAIVGDKATSPDYKEVYFDNGQLQAKYNVDTQISEAMTNVDPPAYDYGGGNNAFYARWNLNPNPTSNFTTYDVVGGQYGPAGSGVTSPEGATQQAAAQVPEMLQQIDSSLS